MVETGQTGLEELDDLDEEIKEIVGRAPDNKKMERQFMFQESPHGGNTGYRPQSTPGLACLR